MANNFESIELHLVLKINLSLILEDREDRKKVSHNFNYKCSPDLWPVYTQSLFSFSITIDHRFLSLNEGSNMILCFVKSAIFKKNLINTYNYIFLRYLEQIRAQHDPKMTWFKSGTADSTNIILKSKSIRENL